MILDQCSINIGLTLNQYKFFSGRLGSVIQNKFTIKLTAISYEQEQKINGKVIGGGGEWYSRDITF